MRFTNHLAAALFLAVPAGLASPALASSPDQWAAFRADVEARCTTAAEAIIRNPKVVVDPVGSDRFGLALIWGKSKSAGNRVSAVCVYDKRTKAVELGSELDSELVRVRKGKPETDGAEEE